MNRCAVCRSKGEYALSINSEEQDEESTFPPIHFCLRHALEMQVELEHLDQVRPTSCIFSPALPGRGLRPEA